MTNDSEVLGEEVSQLRDALQRRPVVQEAQDVLMHVRGFTADEAFQDLRQHARNNNVEVHDLAACLLGVVKDQEHHEAECIPDVHQVAADAWRQYVRNPHGAGPTTTSYNVTVTVVTDVPTRELIDNLVGCHPAVSPAGTGLAEVVITVPADDLRHAVSSALRTVEAAAGGGQVVGIEVVTTRAFDSWLQFEPMPRLLSVLQASEVLDLDPEKVVAALECGNLRGALVGDTWVVQRSAATRAASSDAAGWTST